jgi:hypothetical protein
MTSVGGNKDKQTGWIKEVGDLRNIVMHPTRQQFLTTDQIQNLQQVIAWLHGRIRRIESGSDEILTEKNDSTSGE